MSTKSTSVDDLLIHIVEECGEVVQAYSKCKRFGEKNSKPGKKRTNLEHLQTEMAQLENLIYTYFKLDTR